MPEQNQSSTPKRRVNSALWLGLFLILLAIGSNLFYFLHIPSALLPWVNVALPFVALLVLLLGVVRAFGQPQLYRGKILGTSLLLLSLLLCAGSVAFLIGARHIPRSAGAPQVGQRVPDFTLPDSTGQPISLTELFAATPAAAQPKAILLVFYRGYW